MATYSYEATTSTGRKMTGTIDGPSQEDIREVLEGMELEVGSIDVHKPAGPKSRIGRSEFLLFNQQLASVTKANLPLPESLRELAGDVASRRLSRTINAIADDLEKGTGIEDAFGKYEGSFPALYGKILKAGVQTGRLSEMLVCLNRHLELKGSTRRILWEALAYPTVVLFFTLVVVSGIYMWVVPEFEKVIFEMTSRVPAMTLFVLSIPPLVPYIWLGGIIFAAVIILLWKSMSFYSGGRIVKESIIRRVPLVGAVWENSHLARLCDTMAVIIASGADIVTAVRTATEISSCELLKRDGQLLSEEMSRGTSIVEAGRLCRFIPNMLTYSIQLASQRGELIDDLNSAADMYKLQARSRQSSIQAVLLPLAIILIGLIIAGTVLGITIPTVTTFSTLMG